MVVALLELPGTDRPATVVISTHDLDDVQRLIDHVVFLHEGKLVLSESLDSLLQRHRSIEVTTEHPVSAEVPTPATWHHIERPTPRVLRAIDDQWTEPDSTNALQTTYPHVTIESRPLSLRELYLHFAHLAKNPTAR